MGINKVISCIRENKRFLLTTHINPEGDALGSEIAFYRLLKKLGKEAVMLNADAVPSNYSFLPDTEKIINKRCPGGLKFDCMALLDCSDMSRCGWVAEYSRAAKAVLNIDHHISNEVFADFNWVEPYASSASEMIYKLYKRLRLPFDKKSALLLYVGIATDTGYFRYVNTTRTAHRAAAEFSGYGLDTPAIYKSIYENIPFEDMRLLIQVLPELRLIEGGRIAWIQLKQGILKGKKLSFDLTEEILSFARAIKGVEVVVLFKENMGGIDQVRVNFRSQGKVDVNKIALFFGGGGHKSASGATIKGRIDDVRKKVLAKIKDDLR
ncbi:MAG: bifunctional oligoribonuclease/PAP phosphatase NrnA [Candidatus Omnitrophica bacterium]|nr:bifunctional oligoribonuclease/PAP phosphatase NrnA [Candidatus Omnitrophota bacterium]